MCKKRPIGGFKWIEPSTYAEDKIKNYDDNSSKRALLKVDTEYHQLI